MSGIDTRNRIVASALRLFNTHGLQSVRLQAIADDSGISVGNLAYHFAGKEEILKKATQMVDEELHHIFTKWHKFPGLIDFDNQLAKLYYVLDCYSFYFLDVLNIKDLYPKVHEGQQSNINHFIEQLYLWICNNAKNELFVLTENRQYRRTAERIWFISSYWMAPKKILKKENFDERSFKDMIWQQIQPLFTEKATAEFEMLIYPGLLT